MNIRICVISLFLILFSPFSLAAGKGVILQINGAIGPAIQDYTVRGIAQAEKDKATVVVLEINTPGGLETAMRGINEAIIKSSIPIIAYVAPAGARAASAGTFILYASHLAAMAPGTNLGAASPVNATGEKDSDNKKQSTMEKKAMSDAAAYIRSLAQLRGRNAKWAESAVVDAKSLSAEEAKKLNVINVIASDYAQLLQKLNGETIDLAGKKTQVKLDDIQLQTIEKGWRHDFLAFVTNPNIAYILMLIAMYGLFFELSNPGLVLPGVAGMIALLLVLYAFQMMPINYAGLALIAVGMAFMIAEVFVSSFGALGIGGLIAFLIGSVMLFDSQSSSYQVAWQLIFIMGFLTLSFFLVVINLAIRSQKRKVVSGLEDLIHREATVISVMNQQVIVQLDGEIWEAKSSTMLESGQQVKVTHVHGLTLTVEPIKKSGEPL